MKCQKCGKNEATTYYKENINGQTRELHLCSECAQAMHIDAPFENAFAHMQSGFNSFFDASFPSLLGGFGSGFAPILSDMMQTPFGVLQDTERRCPKCGTTLREIQRTGKAGCPDCYHVFEDVLTPYIRQVQGADSHIGSAPEKKQKDGSKENSLEIMKNKLQEAIKKENYEEAARLRDEIRRQEGR